MPTLEIPAVSIAGCLLGRKHDELSTLIKSPLAKGPSGGETNDTSSSAHLNHISTLHTVGISIFDNCRNGKGGWISIADFYGAVRNGKWRAEIDEIRNQFRSAAATGGNPKKAVKDLKARLPAVTPGGLFKTRKRETLNSPSGRLCADLDNIEDLNLAKRKLAASPHAEAVFVSPTGTGLKAIFRVPPSGEHQDCFSAVRRHVCEISGLQLDEACKDEGRLCFVSYDPELYLNPAATELQPFEPWPSKNQAEPTTGRVAQTHRLSDAQTPRPPDAQVVMGNAAWVMDFLPSEPHSTNRLFFQMARRSLDVEHASGRALQTREIRRAFDHWFDNANKEHLNEDRETYFAEFCRIRSYARTGLREQLLRAAWNRAACDPLPQEAEFFKGEKLRLLVALAFQLQTLSGDKPFYLSSHSAASLLAVAPMQAHRWLKSLEGGGILKCCRRGDPLKRLATEYRYISCNDAPNDCRKEPCLG